MRNYILISAVGTDRIGIVEDISAAVLSAACNIEESRMAILGGEFAALVLASGEGGATEGLMARAEKLGSDLGLSVSIRPTVPPKEDIDAVPYILESASVDEPGIVHSVASALRRRGINIAELETDTAPAPWTGAPMFTMKAAILVPRAVTVQSLRKELEALETEHGLDLKLKNAVRSSETE